MAGSSLKIIGAENKRNNLQDAKWLTLKSRIQVSCISIIFEATVLLAVGSSESMRARKLIGIRILIARQYFQGFQV